MAFRAYLARNARGAWVSRSGAHALRAVVLVLIVNHPAMASGTPLNCAEGKTAIVCVNVPRVHKSLLVVTDKRTASPAVSGSQHQPRPDLPAPFPTPGSQVVPIPQNDFLPHYFNTQRSQLGYTP